MRNPELDRLKATQQSLFGQKQAAFAHYTAIRDEASRAHDAMEAAWQERTRAREEMNREFEARRSAYANHDAVWEEYRRIRDKNDYEINRLKHEADAEHEAMRICFERSMGAYQCGDHAEAASCSARGHEHQNTRDFLNSQTGELIAEIKRARTSAETQAPPVSSADFDRAKVEFELAKARHAAAQKEFQDLKAERDRAKAEFDRLQAEFKRAQDAFRAKLDEVKRARAAEKDAAISKVNMALVKSKTNRTFYLGTIFGEKAKIIPREDGSGCIDVYFAGLHPAGDGFGHGHAVIDRDGNVTYLRDAWSLNHDDYLIDEWKKNNPIK